MTEIVATLRRLRPSSKVCPRACAACVLACLLACAACFSVYTHETERERKKERGGERENGTGAPVLHPYHCTHTHTDHVTVHTHTQIMLLGLLPRARHGKAGSITSPKNDFTPRLLKVNGAMRQLAAQVRRPCRLPHTFTL
jgi:hypothetical protein